MPVLVIKQTMVMIDRLMTNKQIFLGPCIHQGIVMKYLHLHHLIPTPLPIIHSENEPSINSHKNRIRIGDVRVTRV